MPDQDHVSLKSWQQFFIDASIRLSLAADHLRRAQADPSAFSHQDHLALLLDLDLLARSLVGQFSAQRDAIYTALCNLGVSDD